MAYTYDDGGNRLTVNLDGTLYVTYAYDDASRLTQITRAAEGANPALNFTFAYDNANRRTGMTYPNGIATSYTYDVLNRLTNLAATKTSTNTPITNFGYQYDAAGNRTQKSTLDYTEDYKYDPLYRLTRADCTPVGGSGSTACPTPVGPPQAGSRSNLWGYDAVGNRTTAQTDANVTTSSYNEKNQLTNSTAGGKVLWSGTINEPGLVNFTSAAASINGQPARMRQGNVFEAELSLPVGPNTVTIKAQDGSGNIATKNYSFNVTGIPATYTYDVNGNQTTKVEGGVSWMYVWNALNQLIEVKKGPNLGSVTTVATYSYDPLGRRLTKSTPAIVSPATPATSTKWLYDGEDIVRDAVTTTGAGTVTRRFLHGPGIDEPLLFEDATTSALTYLHADALGSIARHTSSTATVTDTISYDSWGNINSGTPSPFGFTGREWDATVALHYYRARYYDPKAGRFIGEDPIGFGSGETNLFSYVGNQPAVLSDPLGLEPNEVYPRRNRAAREALKKIYKKTSKRGALECYSLVCKVDGGFTYTEPEDCESEFECLSAKTSCPDGSRRVGLAHGHPPNMSYDPNDEYYNLLSSGDNLTSAIPPVDRVYVVFANGEMRYVENGKYTTLGQVPGTSQPKYRGGGTLQGRPQ